MSQSTAVRLPARHARPVSRPVPTPPRLRIVAAPAHTRSRAGAAIACVTLLVAGLVTLLLLQMSLERGAYALQRTQSQARLLSEKEQSLQEEIERLRAPQNLAALAGKYGMVPAPQPAFLQASDGKVLGVPAPGVAKPSPTVKSSTPGSTPAASGPGAVGEQKAAAGAAKSPSRPSSRSTVQADVPEN